VLIAAKDREFITPLVGSLAGRGVQIALVSSFPAAMRELRLGASLIVTEVKLGEHNGLHLAMRANAANVPAVVVGPSDAGFERDAAAFGATYLSGRTREDLLDAVMQVLDDVSLDRSVPGAAAGALVPDATAAAGTAASTIH
jgi:hypothetical protein